MPKTSPPLNKVESDFRFAKTWLLSLVLLFSTYEPSLLPIGGLKKVFFPRISNPPATQEANPPAELKKSKTSHEVFGFLPYWKLNDTDGIDFSVLTTLAYFGVPVSADGSIDMSDQGYRKLMNGQTRDLFNRAKTSGTRVVLTITQMNNSKIVSLLRNDVAKKAAVENVIAEVLKFGFEGVNVDFEYVGNPGEEIRNEFTDFVRELSSRLHEISTDFKVTVSVYASSVKDPKMYHIGDLSRVSDGIFMMAYDFAVRGAAQAMPTAPLYGYKSGKYWYDVSTAVEDFLTVADPSKIILGLPWYGYNYPVYEPSINAPTHRGYYYYWAGRRRLRAFFRPSSVAQTYSDASSLPLSGWDEAGQVGYRSYYDSQDGVWRMIFLEDSRSLGLKYDFAKSKNLAGVGIWALGFEGGRAELWDLLEDKFSPTYSSDNPNNEMRDGG